ncbi:hypothetical protein J4430_00755 [Candidatus Woesearchaeota archaeon]|nr:hypothetical protein [Candidatus Woesearchaeota archaeon]
MGNTEELMNLARKVDKILKEELTLASIEHDLAEARIYDLRTVGVQGDQRTYAYPAEITLYRGDKFIWDTEFLEKLSLRVTNEVDSINRVVYVIATRRPN